jgi:acetyl esterase
MPTAADTIKAKPLRDGAPQKSKTAALRARAATTLLNADALTRNSADTARSYALASAAKTGTVQLADADMQAVLEALATLNPKHIENLGYVEARKQPTPADAVTLVLKKQGKDWSPTALVPGVISFDETIPTPAGALPVRIYMPAGVGPFPVVVYFHGGGWVLADKNVYDSGARGIAKQANAVVVSVDYRLAPEAKFPAQHDDALAAYEWVAANASSINGDPKRLAIAGESAGGNLAIATAIAARDRGLTAPLHVLAVYPITQASDMSTPSYQDCENAKPLNRAMMLWFADAVFSQHSDKTDPRIDLIHADLKGLPPVTLINARIDPLRNDADLLANAMKNAGVKVNHKVYEGVTHEFFGMAAVVAKAREAQIFAGQQLKVSLCNG